MFEQDDVIEVAEKVGSFPIADGETIVVLQEDRVINELMRGEYA